MNEVRKMTFGKYKGQPILLVIAEHIGYIMWCFENLPWFRLNDDEQKFYDWEAIAIKKYDMPMTFPVETMYKHVKDKDALERLDTPYQYIGRESFISQTELNPLLREAGAITKHQPKNIVVNSSLFRSLQNLAIGELNRMSEEEIDEMVSCGVTPPIHPMFDF